MLQKAQAFGCWPSMDKSEVREYLEQCPNKSHNVILAARLLRGFLGSLFIWLAMARAASHAMIIER
jgi:hypothetical protein